MFLDSLALPVALTFFQANGMPDKKHASAKVPF